MSQNSPIDSSYNYLPVFKYGNPLLRKKTQLIEDFTIIPGMITKMHETMKSEHGIGLAANQVGWSLNLMLVDTRNYEDGEGGGAYVIINAEILHSEGETIMEEGCLSIPDVRAEIKRPEKIILKYQDVSQKFYEKHFSGITSRVIQHELDHLNGKLFIDHLSQAKRIIIKKRLLEISKTGKPSSGIIL